MKKAIALFVARSYTPSGELSFCVDNPLIDDLFAEGRAYRLTIEPA